MFLFHAEARGRGEFTLAVKPLFILPFVQAEVSEALRRLRNKSIPSAPPRLRVNPISGKRGNT